MGMPIRARLDERDFLNLAGIYMHGGEYVWVFVEDTSERSLETNPWCEPGCDCCPYNVQPKMILEICDGDDDVVRLGFAIDIEASRANSLHKLDTLAAAVSVLRAALVHEFDHYDRRERELEALRSE
jgi:hypothetical protein